MKARSYIPIVLATICVACSNKASDKFSSVKFCLDNQAVIAQTIKANGHDVTVLKLGLVNDTVNIPLSYLAEELQIVPLDNRDEALVGNSKVYVSDNYILVTRSTGSHSIPCKLFKKDGTYIANIGSVGQGPGEYNLIYCAQIDEVGGFVYLLPWNAKAILAYNLKGEFVKSIPLNKKYDNLVVPKGVFNVNSKKNQVAVALLPFKNQPTVTWIQDMEGNFIHEPYADYLKIKPDFSNEINLSRSENHFGFNIFTFWELRKDTLYHFDMDKGELIPRFTAEFKNDPILHDYMELPGHYMCMVTQPKQIAEGFYETEEQQFIIVDKKSNKGNYVRIFNDYLGNLEIAYFPYACTDGYYTVNLEPNILLEQIEKALKNNELTKEQEEQLKALQKQIDEDHNNYIVYAKLKTDF